MFYIEPMNTPRHSFTLLLFLICLLPFSRLDAQNDTQFWFVAPEVTSGHGDSPILLRVSANAQDAEITVSMPANPAFVPINQTIPAGTSQSINLSAFQNLIETKPADQVLNSGILLESSVPVTAYYEVNNNLNPEIFALKGGNALGTEFYTPFPSNYDNGGFSPAAQSGFDIVATADNTTITIIPTANLVGHPAGTPFTIILNRGQTYSLISIGSAAAQRPAGTQITSNKPIAVTLKDDSAAQQGCRDLMGDQLVPTGVIGTEYIVMKGFLGSEERAYVLATENNTSIFLNGNATPASTLNSGQQFTIDLIDPTTYITSSAPVYVLHVSGFGCELGSAVLPSIACTGSPAVFFTRSTSEFFGLNIMVRSGSEGNFILNGSNTLVPAASFNAVNGSNGEWVYAQISFSETDVPIGVTSTLVNTSTESELFHLGVIHGGASTGCRYGYFSDFASVYLGNNQVLCLNDSLLLDAGPDKDTYLWSTGDTLQQIYVSQPGEFWVTATKDGCSRTDTVEVILESPEIGLSDSLSACGATQILLGLPLGYSNTIWSNGATTESITVTQAGVYTVQSLSSAGCIARDTVAVNFLPVPPIPNLQYENPVCEGSNVQLNSPQTGGAVFWEGPSNFIQQGASITINNIGLNQSGIYYVSQEANGCRSDSASFELNVLEAPQISLSGDTLLCAEELSLLSVFGNNDAVQWNTGATTSSIEVAAGSYTVFTTIPNGCNDTLSIQVINAEPAAQISPSDNLTVLVNTPLALNDSSFTPAGSSIESYIWDFEGNEEIGPSVSISFADTGWVNLIYTIANDAGCLDTFITDILVISDVIVPNVFTPNGDGKNDLFVIQNLEAFENAALRIYTRWGRLVYQSEKYINQWDGSGATDGTYFYILDVPLLEKKYEGTVTILR